jgi:hypothetical protein
MEAGEERNVPVVRIFLLVLTLGPILCCAGCLGMAMFASLFPSRAPSRPVSTLTAPREPHPITSKVNPRR